MLNLTLTEFGPSQYLPTDNATVMRVTNYNEQFQQKIFYILKLRYHNRFELSSLPLPVYMQRMISFNARISNQQ